MNSKWRLLFISLFFGLSSLLLISRLFYWQVLASEDLTIIADSQQMSTLEVAAKRGEILTHDQGFLVANQPAFLAYLSKLPDQAFNPDLADKIAPLVYNFIAPLSTPSALLTPQEQLDLIDQTTNILSNRLNQPDLNWLPIARKLPEPQKWALEGLNIDQLFFEEDLSRYYPEASMAAHLVGFVGQDKQGRDVGYHGLEGFYQQDLAGRPGIIRQEKDAFNQPIIMGEFLSQQKKDGRQLLLHLEKSLQFLVEKKLEKAINQFNAKGGSVTVIDPFTGAVLAMASLPGYDPAEYASFNDSLYLNPVVADAFEPGSIFKVLVMAAALDSNSVEFDTVCDICDAPVKIDKYTINTWNNKYKPNSSLTDIIVNSDNVGMVFVGQKLGLDKFLNYFHRFGLTEKTGIDLQDEVVPDTKADKDWTYVDLATASFGQGFVVTSMQLVQAVAAIANGGHLIEPHVVDKIIGDSRTVTVPVKIKHRVISQQAAAQVTQMMVAAAKEGEAKWTATPGYQIAGKTGTAQIAVKGKYDESKTNASFIGFAPADNPKFVMLVTLKEPGTSQWASETAAPLWYSVAQDLLNHFNIIPQPDY